MMETAVAAPRSVVMLGLDLPPVTRTVGWLRADIADVVDAYRTWQEPIVARRGGTVEQRTIPAPTIRAALCDHLAPLVSGGATRHLFLPTRDGTGTAFVDNGVNGTDAFPVCSELSIRLGCSAARVVLVRDDPSAPVFGATILETFVPDDGPGLNYGRVVSATNDGGRWRFHSSGDPFPFEDLTHYRARRIRDRFPPDLQAAYLDELDIPVLQADRFEPARGVIVERTSIASTKPAVTPLQGCAAPAEGLGSTEEA